MGGGLAVDGDLAGAIEEEALGDEVGVVVDEGLLDELVEPVERKAERRGRLGERADVAALVGLLTFGALLNAFGMVAPVYVLEAWLAGALGTQSEAVVLAVRMGLFRTTDQGKTWQDMEVGRFSPTTYGRDVKISPSEPNTLYAALSVAAASHDGGLYRSSDGGQTWKRFDKVQVHGTIMSIGLHHSDPKQVYIGARYDGEVFGTQDGGVTWQALPLPGEVQHIYAIACG